MRLLRCTGCKHRRCTCNSIQNGAIPVVRNVTFDVTFVLKARAACFVECRFQDGVIIQGRFVEFVKCSIHSSRGDSVTIRGASTARFSHCTITSDVGSGVVALGDSSVAFSKSTLRDCAGAVLRLDDTAQAVLDDCQVKSAGRGASVHALGRASLSVLASAVATAGPSSAVEAGMHADVRISASALSAGAGATALHAHGAATVVACDGTHLTAVDRPVVIAQGDARVDLTNCRIGPCGSAGVLFSERSLGSVAGCEITDCRRFGIIAIGAAAPRVTGTRVAGSDFSVAMRDAARASFVSCDLAAARVAALKTWDAPLADCLVSADCAVAPPTTPPGSAALCAAVTAPLGAPGAPLWSVLARGEMHDCAAPAPLL